MNLFMKAIIACIILFFAYPSAFAKKVKEKELVKRTISVQDQRKLDYYFFEAVKLRQSGKMDRAVDLLTKCYYINPNNSAVLYEFAMAFSHIQDVQHAMKFMSLASEKDRTNSWYKMGLAELCIKNNDLKNAILIYKDIAQNHPEAEEVDFMLASLYKQTNQFKESILYLNKVEEKNGMNENISFEKYRLYTALGKNKKANNEIELLIKKFPLEYRYRLLRGDIYLHEEKNPKKALKEYNQVKIADPNNQLLILTLYNYYKTIKDTITADEIVRDAFLNPNLSSEDKMGLLTQYLSIENQGVKKAEEFFKLLIDMYPSNEMLRTYFASFLLMQRRHDEAIPELQFMLELNPKNKEGWMELIKAYFDLEKLDEVISVADTAMVYLPKESNLYLLKGISQLKKEQYESAIETFKTGLTTVTEEEQSKKVEFYLQIADILANQNNLDSAFVYYEKAYQLDPNNATLLNNYAYYLSLINKDLTKAELMSAKTVQAYPDNVSFLDTYAWIFFKQGNMTLAQMYIQQAIDKGGNENGVVMEHYGDILFLNGNKDEALIWWKKAKEAGNNSKLLEEKIDKQTYLPETKEEKNETTY
ncbi:MAG: tetratricopeptide repeat protein [Paludibacteraceae bacterium]|nr:tetratricopeptide repeat protein [Paludibacteraceae bacterium]MBN2786745.1 tetratricopeptide repeat protein [Paludibacteraceae bacterium]